jgi:integrase
MRADLRVGKAIDHFIEAAREGKVLTKHGRRYKPTAVRDLDSALNTHVRRELGAMRLTDVRRGDVQRLVDGLELSGSRVRTVVNALRSLYRWAQDRDLAGNDPAALVRLPAMDATPRDRVAAPREFEQLLAALPPADAVPYALAAYATARRQEIRLARWGAVSFDLPAIELAVDDGKTAAARRVVPILRPLLTILRVEWMRQGRPGPDALVCAGARSGPLSAEALAVRAMKAWGWRRDEKAKRWVAAVDPPLTPIGLHEARHTAASWMNAAGVNPKVASYLMGHSSPERAAAAAAGAPAITLARYTHLLPDDLERAREQLDGYLADRLGQKRNTAEV